jgi:hypothetical protein
MCIYMIGKGRLMMRGIEMSEYLVERRAWLLVKPLLVAYLAGKSLA